MKDSVQESTDASLLQSLNSSAHLDRISTVKILPGGVWISGMLITIMNIHVYNTMPCLGACNSRAWHTLSIQEEWCKVEKKDTLQYIPLLQNLEWLLQNDVCHSKPGFCMVLKPFIEDANRLSEVLSLAPLHPPSPLFSGAYT